MEKIRHIERYTGGKFKSLRARHHLPASPGARRRSRRASRSLAAQAEDAVRSGYSIIIISDRMVDRERVAIPALLALSAIHQHLVGKGLRTSHRPGRRDRLRARSASLRAARRLRRRGGASVSRARDACCRASGRWRRGVEGDQELRQGDRQGPEEGDVQDGHLDLHVLHRRADLRGGGPVARAGRQVLHRHDLERRGHRRVRSRRRSDPRAPRRLRRARPGARDACSTRAANTPGACAAKSTCGRRTRSPSCSTRRAPTRYATYKEYARDHQRPVAAPHDVPRPVRVPLRPAARRCRSRKSSPPPRSSSASRPARCRSARSRPRRTPRSRSR